MLGSGETRGTMTNDLGFDGFGGFRTGGGGVHGEVVHRSRVELYRGHSFGPCFIGSTQ